MNGGVTFREEFRRGRRGERPCLEALEPRQLFDAVPLTEANDFKHSYVDADGDVVTVALRKCTSGVLNLPDGGGDAISLSVVSADPKATVSFSVKKGSVNKLGETSIQRIVLDGVLKSLKADKVVLTYENPGDGIDSVGNDGYIGAIKLKHILNGADIDLPGAGKAVTVSVGYIGGGSTWMEFGSPIKSLKVRQWDAGWVEAPSAGTIAATGGKAVLAGQKQTYAGDLMIDGYFDDDVKTVNVKGDLSGWWNMDRLGKLTVKGWIYESAIMADVSIGSVTCLALADSTVCAGMNWANITDANNDGVYDLPTSMNDLLVPPVGQEKTMYFIKSVKIKGDKSADFSMYNSNIAACRIDSISVAYVRVDNNGWPFGVAADRIQKLTTVDEVGRETFRKLELPEDADGLGEADAVVRIF